MAVKSKSATQIYFNKDHEMVRKAVREFVDKEINPNMDEWEEKGEAPLHDLFKKMVISDFSVFVMIPNMAARDWITGTIRSFWKNSGAFTAPVFRWQLQFNPTWQ